MPKRVVFVGLSGYHYPHTRVRCYHFRRELDRLGGIDTGLLSLKDDLAPERTEADMYQLRDRHKLPLALRTLKKLWPEKNSLFYIQKVHYHAAAPFLLHRLGRNPFIFDYDDYDVELSNLFGRGLWNRLFFGSHQWDVITEMMARRAVCCVAASHELMDFLSPYNERVYYIPTGVDTEAFQPAEEAHSGPVVFLWTGIIWGEPILQSLELLLEAFAEVYRVERNILLRLIGGGNCSDQLQQMLKHKYPGLPVETIDWLDPREMPEQLQKADAGCLPLAGDRVSRWLRSKSPTKMFEYMAAGLPVVSSAVGEPVHVIDSGRNGFLVHDRNEMARAMVQLAQNEKMRRSVGMAARRTVEKEYALPVLGKKLHGILDQLGWIENT